MKWGYAQAVAYIARSSVYDKAILLSRNLSTTSELKTVFASILPREQERLKQLKKDHGTKVLHPVTVNMCVGGMRGITGMLYETSLLDPEEGIKFRGHSIPDLRVRNNELHECHPVALIATP